MWPRTHTYAGIHTHKITARCHRESLWDRLTQRYSGGGGRTPDCAPRVRLPSTPWGPNLAGCRPIDPAAPRRQDTGLGDGGGGPRVRLPSTPWGPETDGRGVMPELVSPKAADSVDPPPARDAVSTPLYLTSPSVGGHAPLTCYTSSPKSLASRLIYCLLRVSSVHTTSFNTKG